MVASRPTPEGVRSGSENPATPTEWENSDQDDFIFESPKIIKALSLIIKGISLRKIRSALTEEFNSSLNFTTLGDLKRRLILGVIEISKRPGCSTFYITGKNFRSENNL